MYFWTWLINKSIQIMRSTILAIIFSSSTEALSNLVWSNDGRTMAFNRSVSGDGKSDQKKQIFVINLATNK